VTLRTVGVAAAAAVNAVAVNVHEVMAVPLPLSMQVQMLTPKVLLSSWKKKYERTNVSRARMILIARRRVMTSTNLKTSRRKRTNQIGIVLRK